MTDFPYSQPQYFCFTATVFQFDSGKQNKTHTRTHKKKTQEKTTPNLHTVKIAECLLLFHSQFDGENMYMSMTEPSQDYVPASQVG